MEYNTESPAGGCRKKDFHALSLFQRWLSAAVAKPILERGGVFEPMQDENFFRECLTVLNDTAAWDVNGDFDPCSCIDLESRVFCQLWPIR